MDNASRYHLRDRMPALVGRDRDKLDDSSADTTARRKFPRTNAESNAIFRKPGLPASTIRSTAETTTFSNQRRKSTFRDATRVPSGPREFPSPSKRYNARNTTMEHENIEPSLSRRGSTSSVTLPILDAPNRSFLLTSESARASQPNLLQHQGQRGNGTHPLPVGSTNAYVHSERASNDFSFLPEVNFDDLQDSMAKYDATDSLLNEFPGVPRPRGFMDSAVSTQKPLTFLANRPPLPRFDSNNSVNDLNKSNSARRRINNTHGLRQSSEQPSSNLPSSSSQPNIMTLRSRRQSSVPQVSLPLITSASAKPPRKSIGPGMISSMSETRKSSLPMFSHSQEVSVRGPREGTPRHDSLNTSRQPNTQAINLGVAQDPRFPVAAASQSRATKTKSSQSAVNEEEITPTSQRTSRLNQHRSHTPSSSGHKRQSTLSGRASGLGARTVSPTDARRLKRLSMMQAPPLPTTQPTQTFPQDEAVIPTLPPSESLHLTQPSPSLIPRKATNSTPTSARASPDIRAPGVSLSNKSSFQSFQSLTSQAQSTSRLPTPKSRQAHSSSTHYNEDVEMVPPVPAIPKAFGSPQEAEFACHVNSRLSSDVLFSQEAYPDLDSNESSGRKSSRHVALPSSSLGANNLRAGIPHDAASRMGDRANAIDGNFRPLPDPNGRKNNILQPLRLPPLNLLPINTTTAQHHSLPSRMSQELKTQHDPAIAQTPEPRRPAKTPSTPMTASKATFFKRQDEEHAKSKMARSSSSHWALRDATHFEDNSLRFLDDDDSLQAMGLRTEASVADISARPMVTPFTSGSLPKFSGEFLRPKKDFDLQRLLSSSEHANGYVSLSSDKMAEDAVANSARKATQSGILELESANLTTQTLATQETKHKKDTATSVNLRRRLSLSWKRSSSKASSHHDRTGNQQIRDIVNEKLEDTSAAKKSDMPPPRLPASAHAQNLPNLPVSMTETSLPILTSGGRPSFEAANRRKSAFVAHGNSSSAMLALGGSEQPSVSGGGPTNGLALPKPRKTQIGDQLALGQRSSSWSSNGLPSNNRPEQSTNTRSLPTPLSAIVKDKDDLAADEEMKRLSQKRKDVDSAARESEQIRARAVAKEPITPVQALHDRALNLNIFERGEIVDYEKDGVYFTGTKNAKKIIGNVNISNGSAGSADKTGNYGYDDERGDYNIVFGDHLAYRYEVIDVLGKGSFGQVVRCIDHKLGGVVAVKIIRNKKRFHQQALVEVGILGRLRDWDPDGAKATLSMTSSFYFRSHLCIVTPCLSINLYELIKAHNFTGFSISLIRRFARQLLSCLILLQQKRIIHCDLKPENILLCEARKADVRVIDFGSSCREEEKVYTYIQSRFYRSPEVILGSSYGLGIDMWSFGCILAELWTGYPIFPGENEQEQLACIMEIFGPPDKQLVERCTRKKLFFDSVGKPRITVSSKGRRRRPSSKTLAQALKTDDDAFLDFISRCLRWDPDRRLKPNDAVEHPFITNLPMTHKSGIPEEARRAPRTKPPVNASVGPQASSPTKKPAPINSQAPSATPVRDRSRLPPAEGAHTAARGPGTAAGSAQIAPVHAMPTSTTSKANTLGLGRRHSTVATAGGAAAVAGSKRASNGTVLTAAMGTQSLAQLAAKESMAGAQAAMPGKWRV